MKFKFLTIKKKSMLLVLALLLALSGIFVCMHVTQASMPQPKFRIVIDAGHGGIDGGAVGKETGVTENFLNLEYAKTLQQMCEDFGIGVTMTRQDMNGLYAVTAPNKKRSDMEKRRQIIESSGADLVVSIHMNSYPLPSAHGAQVFYREGSVGGQHLAESVQASIVTNFPDARKTCKVGDYFMVNCTDKPSIIVECGYLSNPQEERNLSDDAYKEKMCYSILSGVLSFFEM